MTDVVSSSVGEARPYISPDSEIVREMRSIRRTIDEARSAGTLDPLFGYLYATIERRTPAQIRTEAACGPRCAWCCHTRVAATAPEILFLARSLPAGVVEAVPALATRRRDGWDRPLLESLAPCAVLADGLCTAHPSRPIVSRTTVSLDAEQCRIATSNPEEAVIPSVLASGAQRAGYEIARLCGGPVRSCHCARRCSRGAGCRSRLARGRRCLPFSAQDRAGSLSGRAAEACLLRGGVRLKPYFARCRHELAARPYLIKRACPVRTGQAWKWEAAETFDSKAPRVAATLYRSAHPFPCTDATLAAL